jgi:hypothetical protein
MVPFGIELGASSHPLSGPAAERQHVRCHFVKSMRILLALLLTPTLCAASEEEQDGLAVQPAIDRRSALDRYVKEIGSLLEKQAQSVINIAPAEELERLQTEHGAWMLERDRRCSEDGEDEAVKIRELECIAELSELHFTHRQKQISEIKNHFGSRPQLLSWKPYALEAPEDISELPGAYHRGAGKGYNVSLELEQDQTYSAKWDGCLGEYGHSSGTWSLKEGRVLFRPIEETDLMKGHLSELVVGYQDGILFLFPSESDDSFQKYGPNRISVFSRVNEELPKE